MLSVRSTIIMIHLASTSTHPLTTLSFSVRGGGFLKTIRSSVPSTPVPVRAAYTTTLVCVSIVVADANSKCTNKLPNRKLQMRKTTNWCSSDFYNLISTTSAIYSTLRASKKEDSEQQTGCDLLKRLIPKVTGI